MYFDFILMDEVNGKMEQTSIHICDGFKLADEIRFCNKFGYQFIVFLVTADDVHVMLNNDMLDSYYDHFFLGVDEHED